MIKKTQSTAQSTLSPSASSSSSIPPHIESTKLSNGAMVLSETMPGLRSATVGIWVRKGSRHEPTSLNGMCHFIEHAVFKGTKRRSAMDIAVESDRLGGHFDAYTTHEMTAFALKVVDRHAAQAFDLIADMLLNPRFEAEDLAREQRVIIEEMKMVEDSPEEHLAEIFNTVYFPNHPLGLPIEGTEASVSSFDYDKTFAYHRTAYSADKLVIAAAGNIRHSDLVALAEQAFAAQVIDANQTNGFAFANDLSAEAAPVAAAPILIQSKDNLEQAQLIIAAPWVSSRDDERYAASLLASLLGGGTSSRLWQSVREERGLAYSVGASAATYRDTGVFYLYAGTSSETLDEVLDLSIAEMRRITSENVGEDELQLVKDQATSSILLGLESSSARAGSLARQEIIHGRQLSPDEVIRRIEAVTPEDIRRLAEKYFTSDKIALGALGDLGGFEVTRERLVI